ncbi:hypothetical protein [Pseudooctadecabacter jejudonensis]|uniref:Entericidin EcnA/B family protein n=1 Tax=Pseudooctadecabacter jejudonensis TaxID=1391910 RepID=A0A1Y5SYJ6_9RHOB|nr:hypothetical protein [Pseudooctadecabacter jejudonensis]SLN51942.1 hypothetical protein PSJ8397_02740 [Pseudooctadecabacter jejudonensis]
MKTTLIKAPLAILALVMMTACGTAQGIASDAWGATKFVAGQVSGE